jgi:non-homologous end joining protein Ku
MENKKAEDFYSIQDAVAFNIPVDTDDEFYTDFTSFRADFTDKKIFKHLNINPKTNECNSLRSPKKIFLSGYRGTGKTSELLSLRKKIDDTKCYFSIFVDIANEELDTTNIETVDILILMLEKLISQLNEQGADVSSEAISGFYDWYKTKIITEANSKLEGSAKVEIGVDTENSLLGFIGLVSNTKAKLQGSIESKKIIRQEINNNFSMFGRKFNEFILSLVEQFREKNHYQDILFIVDGFEKIGTLEDRKKILVDDANKLTIIESHMIITLPIELFTEKNRLSHFSTIENFPLIDLSESGAKERFKEFILKRVDEKLFKTGAIEKIIEFGAGHPRQTLQIINRAYVEAEDEFVDEQSVTKAIEVLGAEMSKVNDEEIEVLKKVSNKEIIPESDIYTTLKAKNIIFEYNSSSESNIINPIVEADRDFQKYLQH